MPGQILFILFFLLSVSSYFPLKVKANKYSKIPNWLKSSSRLCRKCQPGSYMIRKCDVNHGTLCAPCPARTFTDRSNKMHHCTPCGTCNSNQMVVSLCTKRKDIVCKRVYSAKKFHLHNLRGFQGDQPVGQQKIMEPGSGSMLMSDSNLFDRTFQKAPGRDAKFELGSLHSIEKIPETSGDDQIKPSLFMNDLDFDKALDNDTAYPSSLDPNYNGKNPNPEQVPVHAIPSKFAQEEDLIPITISTKDRNGVSFSSQKSGFTTKAPSERQKRKGKKEKKEKRKKKRIPEESSSFGRTKSIKEAKMFRSLEGDILSTVYKAPEKEGDIKTKIESAALTPDPESVTTSSPDMDNANVTLKPDTDLPNGTQVPDMEPAETEPEMKITTPKETKSEDKEYKVQLNSGKEEPSVRTDTETSTVKDSAKETHTVPETDKSTTIHGLLLPEKIATAANDSTLALQDTEPNHFNSTGVVLGSVFTIIALIIVFLVILHLCGKKRNTKDMRMQDHIKIEISDATEMVPMSNNDAVANKTNVDANGPCPENGVPPPLLNNDFTCAVNDNYRPVSPTDTEPTNGPIVEDVYDIPENLRRKTQQQQQRRQEQQQKELQQQQQQPASNENIDDGETKKLVPAPGT
ncbi:uncharacterized protein LOC115213848 isoform X1 [Octopus sinensis]|uniref:Uncharacterized protein LOC115213848 isoform X1 n=1 Tax=Octopus sinensis TaxID=2607531 RepID=A0A6P7SK53_9MOLL|nr:uncharacterized protein LOC115213848 isoform X1 [Octopus sinensis]